jgi:hypothetical protein
MDFLTAKQKATFAAVNARLGLGPEEFTAALSPGALAALPPVRRMSSKDDSDFPPRIISVGSIEEMRKLVGHDEFVPPQQGSEPDYPVAPPQAEIDRILNALHSNAKSEISPELIAAIDQAAIAYVCGNPDKVAAFVPLINAAKFPGRAAVFTGDKLEVPGGATHMITGDDPVVLNYGQITVAHGATIKIKTSTFISSQVFTQELGTSLDAPPQYTYTNIGDPWDQSAQQGGVGPTGPAQTNHGTNGASHYNTSNCKYDCDTQPQNGPPGNAGGTGLIGAPGQKGHPSSGATWRLGEITNPITCLIGGGDGQKGGKGGPGGPGGPGGAKGTPANGCSNNPSDGPQGPGGKGGPGGPGGPGGDSGFVTIYYSYSGQGQGITVTVRTVGGGKGGDGGDPGTGGAGQGNLGQGDIGTPPGTQGAIPKYALNRS